MGTFFIIIIAFLHVFLVFLKDRNQAFFTDTPWWKGLITFNLARDSRARREPLIKEQLPVTRLVTYVVRAAREKKTLLAKLFVRSSMSSTVLWRSVCLKPKAF